MTSIYRPKMGQRGPLAAPSSPLVPQQPAPYKPAPVAPGINFNPPQQPAAPMLPGQQQPQQAQQTQQYTGDVFAKPAVMPEVYRPGEEPMMTMPYRPDMQPPKELVALPYEPTIQTPLTGIPKDIPFGKPIPEKYVTPTNPFLPPGMGRGYPEMPGMGGRGRGFGGQRQMMQQMMQQMQMMQEMMRQQQMMRNMSRRNRGGSMNPFAEQLLGKNPMTGFGPNINNFQGPDVSGTMEEMPMGMYKKGGTVKEKKMAMGGMGGMSGPGMYGVAPGMSRGLAQKVGAANQAEAMSQLKGAIGAPGGVAGGTMKNALGALRGMKKGGKVEDSEMVGKEVSFMKKKGAPKSMIKHEEAEMKGYARGGGIESKGKTKGKVIKMAAGGMVGRASSRADGCAQRGKTKGKQIKMAGGGSC